MPIVLRLPLLLLALASTFLLAPDAVVRATEPEAAVGEPLHHDLDVKLEPGARRLAVEDRIRLPTGAPRSLQFRLHAGLKPQVISDGATLTRLDTQGRGVPVEIWRLRLEPGVQQVDLRYAGEIHHPVAELGAAYSRSFSVSPGLIDADGVFLGGSSHWLPSFVGYPTLTFTLTVDLPEGWRALSQGRREDRRLADGAMRETWSEDHRQEEVYLIAAPFTEYRQPGAVADAVVFLREPDEALANRYLELTGRYLAMYEALIGDYPYAKFALVENFWETGYGMPSFTLLGPRVIRLPFIPFTSYPHEILHNWWGNGVYVDFAAGNWSEGLTSYLADHLLKEQRGKGADYRREALQKYADYVGDHEDFPLTAFRGRHNAVTEAVGYGKTLMVFHMLRQTLGDAAFRDALRRFYESHQFRVASWSDVAASFEAVGGDQLKGYFAQWVDRAGAPSLRLRDASVEPSTAGYRLQALLEQTQEEPAYRLEVPLAIMVEGQEEAMMQTVAMNGREQSIQLTLPARPLRMAVDPAFDLFRRLYREEIPPAISQALGAEQALVVLPAAAPKPLQQAYRQLAESWQRGRSARVEIRRDDQLEALPADRAVWLLGWRNRFRPLIEAALDGYDFAAEADRVRIAGTTLRQADNSLVVLARDPANPEQALGWVATDNPAAIPGLARKLPHYGKYSYLGFRGDAPENLLKGQWPAQASPLSVSLVEDAPSLTLPARAPLTELPPAFSAERMMGDLRRLSDPSLRGRGLGSEGLDQAAEFIAERFEAIGLEPAGDSGQGFVQVWEARSGEPERLMTLRNIVGRLPGRDPALAERPLIIGAHYDHLGMGWPDVRADNAGKVHQGADDNASGVAVMLELARALAQGSAPARPVLFVAFSGEEAGRLGSRYFIDQLDDTGAQAFAMLNLDTVGRLEGGALFALGASSGEQWGHILRGAGYVTGVEVRPVVEPLDSSDQTSFIAAGIPAVQLFSGAHPDYHRPTDTADKIDAAGLVQVASVAGEAIGYLTGSDARLTPSGAAVAAIGTGAGPVSGSGADGPERAAPRQAALGTVPDFAFAGEGVRLTDVMPDSPAAGSGLREGDIVVAVNGQGIADLRGYAEVLRGLTPGDAVAIQYQRDGAAQQVETRAVAR